MPGRNGTWVEMGQGLKPRLFGRCAARLKSCPDTNQAGRGDNTNATKLRRRTGRNRGGQTTLEFVMAFAGVVLPLTFATIFSAEVLWIWHSVNDWTRQGAGYASTHCYVSDAQNVLDFMKSNVPLMLNQFEFQNGPAQINVTYLALDPTSGLLGPPTCAGGCDTQCIPQTVNVSVTGYQFSTFLATVGLPPITLPNFQTSVPMESAGCDPEQGVCLP